jgi:hypothetical protein
MGATPVTFGVYASTRQETPGTADDDVECVVVLDTMGRAFLRTQVVQGGTPLMINESSITGGGPTYTITAIVAGTTVECVFAGDIGTFVQPVTLPTSATSDVWLPGLETSGDGTARFDFFTVVTDVH